MRRLCGVKAELENLISAVETKHGPQGMYWLLEWSMVVKFGGTKLRACIRWNDRVFLVLYFPGSYPRRIIGCRSGRSCNYHTWNSILIFDMTHRPLFYEC
jgi:hypothetical protein